MPPFRPVRALLVLLLLGFPAMASARSVPVAVYPVSASGTSAEDAKDAESMLESAIRFAARQRSTLIPASPLMVRAACGKEPAPDCLSSLAGDGLVLLATPRRVKALLEISLVAVDGRGAKFGPVVAQVDTYIQSSAALAQAVSKLVDLAAPALPPPAQSKAGPGPSPRSEPVQWGLKAPSPDTAGSWKRPAGMSATALGGALLAGSAALAVVNWRSASALDEKSARNALAWSDREAFDRVDRLNTLTVGLAVGGAVLAATGITLWSLAPQIAPTSDGVAVGAAGRF